MLGFDWPTLFSERIVSHEISLVSDQADYGVSTISLHLINIWNFLHNNFYSKRSLLSHTKLLLSRKQTYLIVKHWTAWAFPLFSPVPTYWDNHLPLQLPQAFFQKCPLQVMLTTPHVWQLYFFLRRLQLFSASLELLVSWKKKVLKKHTRTWLPRLARHFYLPGFLLHECHVSFKAGIFHSWISSTGLAPYFSCGCCQAPHAPYFPCIFRKLSTSAISQFSPTFPSLLSHKASLFSCLQTVPMDPEMSYHPLLLLLSPLKIAKTELLCSLSLLQDLPVKPLPPASSLQLPFAAQCSETQQKTKHTHRMTDRTLTSTAHLKRQCVLFG